MSEILSFIIQFEYTKWIFMASVFLAIMRFFKFLSMGHS